MASIPPAIQKTHIIAYFFDFASIVFIIMSMAYLIELIVCLVKDKQSVSKQLIIKLVIFVFLAIAFVCLSIFYPRYYDVPIY